MTSLTTTTTTTRCPNSFQLRLALDSRKCPSLLVKMRFHKLDSKVRVFCGANGAERRRKGNSWMNSNSSVDAFSGWSEKDGNESEQSTQPPKKQWFGGIVGASVAGVVLVAGLTFATLSMSKRASRLKQQMEPLTEHVEESLDSADQDETVENERNGSTDANAVLHNFSQESKAGIGEDSLSYAENNESTNENKLSHDTDVDYASDGGDVIDSTQQDLQNESAIDEIPVAPMGTPKLSESEVPGGPSVASSFEDSGGNLVAERIELSTESKENPIDDNRLSFNIDHKEVVTGPSEIENSNFSVNSSSNSFDDTRKEPIALKISLNSQLDAVIEPQVVNKEDMETVISLSNIEDVDLNKMPEVVVEGIKSSLEVHNLNGGGSLGTTSVSALAYPFADKQSENVYDEVNDSRSFFDSMNSGNFSSSAGIPAPSVVSPALKALPGKVLVPAVIDQVQGQALAALQVLKVIEVDVQPGDLCTRREYARWLVSASSALSRNSVSKVYPAMYIENVTELGFDDITPEDPDFPSIQGLAEAGLIASKLSRRDMSSSLDEDESSFCFCPESPLSRQDLVSWKMSLEKKQLPVADRKILQELSGFIDVDRINPDAWPALLSDLPAGEQGITALAFGYTRLFQPDKPVTKAQAAIALATGEASDLVSEELARIEAESMAEKAVAAHSALVDQVEKDVNASFEKELMLEREKIDAVEKMAEEARRELERLRAEREEENMALMKERAAVDSEMEVLSRLRREVEEQLQGLMSNKVEISYEKERISKLRKDAETENQEIAKLQYDLEVERKALSMARSWAEEEAKRAREQAKVLEEARGRWEKHGIKVVVDDDLRKEANATDTWVTAGTHFSIEGTVDRAENLVDKLKAMATDVKGKSQNTINKLIQKILLLISMLKEWAFKVGKQAGEMKDGAVSKVAGSLQGLQQSSAEFSLSVKQGAKRVAGDCKEGVEKLTQKFKT